MALWKRQNINGSNSGADQSVANRFAKLDQHIETGLAELGQGLQTLQEEGIPSMIGDETMNTGTFGTHAASQLSMIQAGMQEWFQNFVNMAIQQ